MPTCPKCLEPRPYRWFESRARLYPWCRECRKREANRLAQQKRRAFIAGKDAILGVAKARAERLAQDALAKAERRLKTRFNRLTASDRARLAVLLKKPDKGDRTLAAIEARKAHLHKYEQALARQLKMVQDGVPPGDLLDWLDE